MPVVFLEPDVISYNAMASSPSWENAMTWAELQQQAMIQPDVISYTSVIRACDQWQMALKLLEAMDQSSIQSNQITFNAFTTALASTAQWQRALVMLGSGRPNVVTYSAAISACEKAGEWQVALTLLNMMLGWFGYCKLLFN